MNEEVLPEPTNDLPAEPTTDPIVDQQPAAEEVIVVEPEPAVEPEVVTAVPKSKYREPVAVTEQDIEEAVAAAARPVPAGPAVVSNNEVDDVLLSACVYKNLYAKKSLTVHHLQRRLGELGYTDALRDKDGYYADFTKKAVALFQKNNSLDGAGIVDEPTFLAIFRGDVNVKPIV